MAYNYHSLEKQQCIHKIFVLYHDSFLYDSITFINSAKF